MASHQPPGKINLYTTRFYYTVGPNANCAGIERFVCFVDDAGILHTRPPPPPPPPSLNARRKWLAMLTFSFGSWIQRMSGGGLPLTSHTSVIVEPVFASIEFGRTRNAGPSTKLNFDENEISHSVTSTDIGVCMAHINRAAEEQQQPKQTEPLRSGGCIELYTYS